MMNKNRIASKSAIAENIWGDYIDQSNDFDFIYSQIKNLQYDIFHPTYYDNYFLAHLKKPLVLTVHDMIHEKYAEYFGNSFDSINFFLN